MDGTESGTALGIRDAPYAGRGRISRMRVWGSESMPGKSVGETGVKREADAEDAGKWWGWGRVGR